ncbi:hypothetical protein BH11BAC4_BH11BAC4_24190 [soil metagenome]
MLLNDNLLPGTRKGSVLLEHVFMNFTGMSGDLNG